MTLKKIYILIGVLLLAGAGIAATLSYDSDGNYVGLPVLSALFSQPEADTVTPPAYGSQPSTDSLALLNGTALTPVPLTPPDNGTSEDAPDAPKTLGNVYAVDYRTSPPHGSAPMLVRFVADNATTTPCNWTFGDGHSSTELDHFHTYKQPGTYTVTLTRGQYTANLTFTVEPPGVVPLPENEEMMF